MNMDYQNRDRGCRFCRQRKVECDMKKPRCSECVAANENCGGYNYGQVFINISAAAPPPVWNRSHNAQKYLLVDLQSDPNRSQEPVGEVPAVLSASNASNAMESETIPTMAKRVTQSFDPAPERITILAQLFVDLFYKAPGPHRAIPGPISPHDEAVGSWRSLLPLWVGHSILLDTAIGALSTAFIGSQFRDEQLIYASRTMYTEALRLLQQAILEPNTVIRKDIIAANLVMGSTELFLSNGSSPSWRKHVQGGTKLLQECLARVTGPNDFDEIHLYALNIGLFEALAGREEYIFSQPEWQGAANALFATPRTCRNILYDMWCQAILPLPNVLKQADDLEDTSFMNVNAKAQVAMNLLESLSSVEKTLQAIQESIQMTLPEPSFYTSPRLQVSTEIFAHPLTFASAEVATIYNLQWTSQLLLHSTRCQLWQHLSLDQTDAMGMFVDESPKYASFICRSVQYCTSNTSFAATEAMFLPLYTTAAYYTRIEDEQRRKWCADHFVRIVSEQNVDLFPKYLDTGSGKILRSGPPLKSPID